MRGSLAALHAVLDGGGEGWLDPGHGHQARHAALVHAVLVAEVGGEADLGAGPRLEVTRALDREILPVHAALLLLAPAPARQPPRVRGGAAAGEGGGGHHGAGARGLGLVLLLDGAGGGGRGGGGRAARHRRGFALHAAEEEAPGARVEPGHRGHVPAPQRQHRLAVYQPLPRRGVDVGQLLLHLRDVLRVEDVEEGLAGQVLAREVQRVADRLRHEEQAAPGGVHHEHEAVGAGDDQLLQLLVGQHGRLVVALGVGVQAAADGLHVLHGEAQDGQLVRLAGHLLAGGDDVAELLDVGVHLVPPPLLDLAVVLPEVAALLVS